ncbi:MAG: 2,3-bisphosphoglycerate-independent phosphoglycerate mutase, partial [Gemmatimonadota bacterium]
MAEIVLPDAQVNRDPDGGKIVLLVLDGLGGLPDAHSGRTELETARTPNLDALAARSSLGMMDPVAPGITPGSGPGHLALFGYDPVGHLIGRGVLCALGIGFELRIGDVAARLNLASFDDAGNVTDRRAGRPSDEEGARAVEKVRSALSPADGAEVFLQHVKEHRAVLILRGEGLGARLDDTDPQETGVPPDALAPEDDESKRASEIVRDVLDQSREILGDQDRIQGFLARGFARFDGFPSVTDRFGLHATALARYPMYRGVARLVGMEIPGVPESDEAMLDLLEEVFESHDFCFVHFKAPDARGEDGDFPARVRAIEDIDALLPRITALEPDVIAVTGDHSTPAAYRAHSWHAVPVLLASRWARPTATTFGESTCRTGDLGR